jgi:hypothetical protein
MKGLWENVPSNLTPVTLQISLSLFAVTGWWSMQRLNRERAHRARQIGPLSLPCKSSTVPATSTLLDFDVLIIGSGPAGSTAAFFAKEHNNQLKIGLFDKKAFPRSKPCGDAWCAPALQILEEMGILDKVCDVCVRNAVCR